MDKEISKYLKSFEFGELQHYKNMGVFPIITSLDESPEYMMMKEALEKNLLVVEEVSHGGSVPELKVVNRAEIHVLLLDGEELAGAKQNRVLNTTILVKQKSETVIPVSCTERGRWSYVSAAFHDSGTIMSPKMRMMKGRTVAASLETSHEYRSDQGAVWEAIDAFSVEAGHISKTGAMKDVYEAKKRDLDAYLKAFSCVEKQKGLLTIIGGEVIGFDFVSHEVAYGRLHPKLVKSYAMEAIIEKRKKTAKPGREEAKEFVDETGKCVEKRYESVGLGWDYRYEGEKVVGSALKVDGKVIHMAFFKVSESDKAGEMAGYRRRRGFRIT